MGTTDPRVVAATRMQLRSFEDALRRGARRIGWKVAFDFPEITAVIGDAPVIGHLTSQTLLPRGTAFSASRAAALRVETELVIEMGAALDVGAEPAEVEAAVVGFGTGLEIVDVQRPPDDLEGIIAANVAHRACVIGARKYQPCPTGAAARIVVNGCVRQAARLPAGHVERLEAVARLLAAVGLRLEAGDLVLAGSLTHVEASSGDHVLAEIDGFESVDVQLVE